MTDNKNLPSQKELFKQYLSSRNKLKAVEQILKPEVIKKHDEDLERRRKKYSENEEYKKKKKEYQNKRYNEIVKPKRIQAKQQQETKEDNIKNIDKIIEEPIIEEPIIEEPQEEKRQSKKLNDIHNLFNRHLFV